MADLDSFLDDVAKVRALVPDVEMVPNPNRPGSVPEFMFTSVHIQALLDLTGNNIWRTTALCIDAIAVSEVLISKVITSEDLATDGAKVMNALRLKAERFYTLADKFDADQDGAGFTIVPFYLDPPQLEWR